MDYNQNQDQSQNIDDLFGMNSGTNAGAAQQQNQVTQNGSVFDYSSGKTFEGIGDVKKNSMQSWAKLLGFILGGGALALVGLGLLLDFHLIFGPLFLIVGAILVWMGIEADKTKCPQCKRIAAMEQIASDEISAETDVTRFNVYYNHRYSHDEVNVKASMMSYDVHQCSYCGYVSGGMMKHKLASYKKDVM